MKTEFNKLVRLAVWCCAVIVIANGVFEFNHAQSALSLIRGLFWMALGGFKCWDLAQKS